MLFINLKSRLLNKAFWASLISLLVLLSQQFGFDITTIIPKNYTDIINTVFAILALLGIIVDTSTPGINDTIVSNRTVQATNTAEEIKTEKPTTAINNTISENSQSGLSDSEAISGDKESETNVNDQASSNVQVSSTDSTTNQTVDVASLQAENEALKAHIQAIQAAANGNVIIA